MNQQKLVIALTKGRILEEVLPLLEEAGVIPAEDISQSRKLIFDSNIPDVQLWSFEDQMSQPMLN